MKALPALAGVSELPFVVPSRSTTPLDPTKPAQGDAAKTPANPVADLGLNGINRITGQWGFQGKALFTDFRIEPPAPRKGLVAILDQPAFRKDRLPPLPRGAATFAIQSFDVGQAYQMLVTGLKAVEPEVGDEINQFEKWFEQTAGVRLRDDLLKHLGPMWTVFRFPTESGPNTREKSEFDVNDYAVLAGVDDSTATLKMLDTLAARFNQYFRDAYKSPGDKEDDSPILALERLPAPDRGFQLTSPARLVLWLNEVRPTMLVGKSFVSCAASLEHARLALGSESDTVGSWKPSGELRQAFDCLPDRLCFLAVVDHRDSGLPEAIAGLPASVQTVAAIFAPGCAGRRTSQFGSFVVRNTASRRISHSDCTVENAYGRDCSHLFPSVIATTVDARGFRLLAREAFPFVCLGSAGNPKLTFKF